MNRLPSPQEARDGLHVARALSQQYPKNAHAQFHLGLSLQLVGLHAEAVDAYRKAMAVDPDMPNLRNNLAAALIEGDPGSWEAQALLTVALTLNPDDVLALINIARVHLAHMNLPKALACERRAIELDPNNVVALSNYALKLCEAQRWEEARWYAVAACERDPANQAYLWNLAQINLRNGNFAEGWPQHEARWDGSRELRGSRPRFPAPVWRGESLTGKTLLVWGEQGHGDTLQFCRYLPLLHARVREQGGRLLWANNPQLGALPARTLARCTDDWVVATDVRALPRFDYEISLLSLPLVFDTRVETIPSEVPYLRADHSAVSMWRERLSGERRLKVGLAWTGSSNHSRNPYRKVDVARLASILGDVNDCAFYSLQPGAAAEVAVARAQGMDIEDYTKTFATFDDTAAFIGALDLVVTVCTSVAHLCGALGQKTWVLLDVNPHWVWMTERDDSPWYPTLTLYRQGQFAQWEPVLQRVRLDLGALARKHAETPQALEHARL
jgi:Tfp pilus assembly protein PilF